MTVPQLLPTGTEPGRTLVMGILNVTPDSFSDGGRWSDPDAAVDHGLELIRQGADIIDVGGESTRPGSQRPSVADELERVVPVVRRLVQAGVTVSVDTMRAEVARGALEVGAHLINDVSGGLADPQILRVVAEAGVPYVAMHWRAHGSVMNERAVYQDVVAEVCAELEGRVEAAMAAGIARESLILDPGLGFSKEPAHNWALLAAWEEMAGLGFPLLIGASRKRFLGALLADTDGTPAAMAARDAATAAVSTIAAHRGAWAVRVHDVPGSVAAVRVAQAVAGAGRQS